MAQWTDEVDRKAAIITGQMGAAMELVKRYGTLEDNAATPYLNMLRDLYCDEMPTAVLLDNSHVILHAEGPGAAHGLPWLSALNWLTGTTETTLRRLSAATLDLLGGDGIRLAKGMDLRLSGFAEGSLLIGVKLLPPPGDLLPEDTALVDTLVGQVQALPELTRFIDDEGLRPGIEEAQPDPALRDAQLSALHRLSPTGRRGIHTLEISSRGAGIATLSQRERVVLTEALRAPQSRRSRHLTVTGQVREADLDKTRVHLRGVPEIGTLRCIVPNLGKDHAKRIMGETVRVAGTAHLDATGRPRLLLVEHIEPVEQTRLPVDTE